VLRSAEISPQDYFSYIFLSGALKNGYEDTTFMVFLPSRPTKRAGQKQISFKQYNLPLTNY